MIETTNPSQEKPGWDIAAWKTIVAKYQMPHSGRAWWQLANTILPYLLLWVLMYLTVDISWWLTLPLAILAGGLLVRIFIIFHDCGHYSFFRSRRMNDLCGFVCGFLTFTPYHHWRWEHALHHATAGDLDRRGVGDVWTMTVAEYLAAPRWQRGAYRFIRHPLVLFVIGPLFFFLVSLRLSSPKANRRERHSVWLMNLALLALALGLSSVYGLLPYLVIQLTSLAVAGSAGIWLFYVQHQFEDVYWERGERWDYTQAALRGSSYYKLPRVLQWFSANIGFHHIHHLSPRIPNYNLERCHQSDPMFQAVKPITLVSSLKSLSFRLWDESARQLVGFGHLRRLQQNRAKQGQPTGNDD